MMENRVDDIPQVSEIENEILITMFIENEVKEPIFQMEHNRAPGLDGLIPPKRKTRWCDAAMFYDFFKGELSLFSLNFGIINLLTKCQEAITIQQYKLIYLLNVSFKIFTKITTNGINKVAQKVIQPSQTASLLGRYILKGVIILHRTIHELHRKKAKWGDF